MELKEFTNYANSFQAIARLELESITLLLDFLGHPERELEFIHVAGTNGKGSVCAFLQEIFSNAGYRCGKYISPNMVSVCERISINGVEITENELKNILEKVQKASEKVSQKLGEPPTQFEIWTAAAFCYFKDNDCDLVILETGLGGCRDATNVIPPPKASVITRIDIDHTAYLGDTLTEITAQKAGIIKKHKDGQRGLTVTGAQNSEVMKKLKEECEAKNNALKIADSPDLLSPDGMYERFDYKGIKNLRLGIAGYHQIENACIAIETALCFGIPETAVRQGLENAKNIGRFELLEDNPPLIFDGAHNPNGMQSLVFGLKRYFPKIPPVFIMGFMADKDISGALQKIKDAYGRAKIFAVEVRDNPRAMQAEQLVGQLVDYGFDASACPDIKTACDLAKQSGELVVICGSLYLYKDYAEQCDIL